MIKMPNLKMDSEVTQDWFFASLKYNIDLILMGKYRESKNMRELYNNYFTSFSLECKIMYAIYVYLLNGNDEVWKNNIQDIKELPMYEYYFGKLLLESDANINSMIDKLDNEIHKYENIGIKDAYQLEKELYTTMVRRTITKRKEGIQWSTIAKIREEAGIDLQGTNVYGLIRAAEMLGLYDKDINEPVWEVVLGQYTDGKIDWHEHNKWFNLLNKLDNIKWSNKDWVSVEI